MTHLDAKGWDLQPLNSPVALPKRCAAIREVPAGRLVRRVGSLILVPRVSDG